MDAVARPTTTLDPVAGYVAAAERFAVAVAWTDMRASVVSCPGWSAYDLVVHLGNVHAWSATIVETGRAAVEQNDEPRSAKARVVSAWYAGKAEDLYEVLRHSAPDAPCWNFVHGTGVAGFWPRRQLHETTIHQVDLDTARGQATGIETAVCLDGIDEALTVMLHRMHSRGQAATLDEPLALTATDTGDTWLVAPQPRASSTPRVPTQPVGTTDARVSLPPSVERRRTPTTAAADRVEASADVLYRLLWHRPVDDGALRVIGDDARVEAFLGSRLTP